MARFGNEFKARAVARFLPPESASILRLSQEIGASVAPLERWMSDALSQLEEARASPGSANNSPSSFIVHGSLEGLALNLERVGRHAEVVVSRSRKVAIEARGRAFACSATGEIALIRPCQRRSVVPGRGWT